MLRMSAVAMTNPDEFFTFKTIEFVRQTFVAYCQGVYV